MCFTAGRRIRREMGVDLRYTIGTPILDNMYENNITPEDLCKTHKKLDKAVEKLYRDKSFNSYEERLEFLLE